MNNINNNIQESNLISTLDNNINNIKKNINYLSSLIIKNQNQLTKEYNPINNKIDTLLDKYKLESNDINYLDTKLQKLLLSYTKYKY